MKSHCLLLNLCLGLSAIVWPGGTLTAEKNTPSPTPVSPDVNQEEVDAYQECIQKMIEQDEPSDVWMQKCLEDGRKTPKKSPPPVQLPATLDKNAIHTYVSKNMRPIYRCYHHLIESSKDLKLKPEGIIEPQYQIKPDGTVTTVTFNSNSMNDVGMLRCVKKAIEKWNFPAFSDKENLTITYQFKCSANQAGKTRLAIMKNYPIITKPESGTDDVQRVTRTGVSSLRACYESLLKRKPSATGSVTAKIIISSSGSVSKVDLPKSDIDERRFKSCLIKRIKHWKYPASPTGQSATVVMPLEFKPR